VPIFFRPTSPAEQGYAVAAIATELGAIAGLLIGVLLGSIVTSLFASVLSDGARLLLLGLPVFLGWLTGGFFGCKEILHRLRFPKFKTTALWVGGLMGALLLGVLLLSQIAPSLDTAWSIFLLPAFLGAFARFLATQ
jgi:hypothetical protein